MLGSIRSSIVWFIAGFGEQFRQRLSAQGLILGVVASGLAKTVAIKKQSGLGTAAGSGAQLVRREQGHGELTSDVYENTEIVSHRQSTGATHGFKKGMYNLQGLLSPGTYALPFAALLMRDFTGVTTIAAASGDGFTISSNVLTRAAGAGESFFTDGLKVGMMVRFGAFHADNDGRNALVTAVTATTATLRPMNGVAFTNVGTPDTNATLAIPGKRTYGPMTGHTNDYYTIEDYYSDLVRSELFTDARWGKADVNIPASGNAKVTFTAPCIDRDPTGSQVLTTPTAETTTGVLTGVHGLVLANGTAIANITGCQFSIDGDAGPVGPVLGSDLAIDVSRGRVKVSGNFTAFFDSVTLQSIYENRSVLSLVIAMMADDTATSDFMVFTIGRAKLFGDAPNDQEKEISRTYPFTAELNTAGGAGTAYDATIIAINDSDAA